MKAYSRIVLSTHAFISKKELKRPLDELRALFMVQSKFAEHSLVKVYRETRDFFGFPRYYRAWENLTDELEDRTVWGEDVKWETTFSLRDRQVPVIDNFVRLSALGRTGFLLHAGTGTGKTIMALKMLSILKKPALVIVPREYIIEQWRERILEHTTLTVDDIGIAQQNRCVFEGKKIVLGMIHSLVKDKYPEEFKRYFSVVLYDECHILGAQSFSKTTGMFPARVKIGLSATPVRADGLEQVFQLSIGQEELKMLGGTDVLPKVILRDYLTDQQPGKLRHISDKLSRRGVIISALAGDFKRNVLLAFYVKKLVDTGRRTLLLSDRKDQIKVIHDLLASRYGMVPRDIGIFVQETSAAERERVLSKCPVILATYGMMAMAVDVPDLSGLIFATPLSEVTQPLGRVLRLHDDKLEPVVVDLVDLTFKETRRWAVKRRKLYQGMGVRIAKVYGAAA